MAAGSRDPTAICRGATRAVAPQRPVRSDRALGLAAVSGTQTPACGEDAQLAAM